MRTPRHPVDFSYTRPELEALFADARAHDVEQGGHDDARAAAINVWSHHWLHEATQADSDLLGTFYVRWGEPARLWEIETEAGFSLDDLMAELGRLELQALGYVKHGNVPSGGRRP